MATLSSLPMVTAGGGSGVLSEAWDGFDVLLTCLMYSSDTAFSDWLCLFWWRLRHALRSVRWQCLLMSPLWLPSVALAAALTIGHILQSRKWSYQEQSQYIFFGWKDNHTLKEHHQNWFEKQQRPISSCSFGTLLTCPETHTTSGATDHC